MNFGRLLRKFLSQEVCKILSAGVLIRKFNKNGVESEFLKRTLEMDAKIMVVIGLMNVSFKICKIMIRKSLF
jgi:hypothetical protein